MLWRKTLTYWKSFFTAGIIAYGCLLRKPLFTLPPIEDGDKWIHCLTFMLFTLVLLWDCQNAKIQAWKKWIVVITIPIVYGGLIELLQEHFFYPRTGEWMDWLADCIGVIMAVFTWIIGQKLYERRTT